MGGEGAQWIGQAPFTDVKHMFQNVGDGTFFHSGQLAVQAVHRGGREHHLQAAVQRGRRDDRRAGRRGRADRAEADAQAHRRGRRRSSSVAEDPTKYRRRDLAEGTLLWHRDRLDEAQQRAARGPGRHGPDLRPAVRRRGAPQAQARSAADAAPTASSSTRRVCEGCGDCGVKSQLPVGAAGRHRVRPQDPHRPDLLQHRLLVPRRRLPVVRHGRAAGEEPQGTSLRRKAATKAPRRDVMARRSSSTRTPVADADADVSSPASVARASSR